MGRRPKLPRIEQEEDRSYTAGPVARRLEPTRESFGLGTLPRSVGSDEGYDPRPQAPTSPYTDMTEARTDSGPARSRTQRAPECPIL